MQEPREPETDSFVAHLEHGVDGAGNNCGRQKGRTALVGTVDETCTGGRISQDARRERHADMSHQPAVEEAPRVPEIADDAVEPTPRTPTLHGPGDDEAGEPDDE